MLLNCGLESPLDCKEIQPVHPKGNPSWIFIGKTEAKAETPMLWLHDAKRPLNGKDPDAGKDWRREEKGTTGWDGWMASRTQWTWVWASSRSWWWTGRPGVLQSMESQGVGHCWVTELNWTELIAAAAKSLQSCPTLRPHGLQPTRLLCPWDSPGKNTGVGCHFLLQLNWLDPRYSSPSWLPLDSHWRAGIADDCDILLYW